MPLVCPTDDVVVAPRLLGGDEAQPLDAAGLRPCDGGPHCRCGQGSGLPNLASAIVFLDIDGVLHATSASLSSLFAAPQMAALRRILCLTGARVVLSSAWRLHDQGVQQVVREFHSAGLAAPVSATPSLCPCAEGRPLEIRAWLIAHATLVERDRWVAIDDLPLFPDLPAEHVVTTSGEVGLTAQQADAAIAKLGARRLRSPRGGIGPGRRREEAPGADLVEKGLPLPPAPAPTCVLLGRASTGRPAALSPEKDERAPGPVAHEGQPPPPRRAPAFEL